MKPATNPALAAKEDALVKKAMEIVHSYICQCLAKPGITPDIDGHAFDHSMKVLEHYWGKRRNE